MKKSILFVISSLFIISSINAEVPLSGSLEFYSGFDSTKTDFYRNAINSNLVFQKAMNKTTVMVDIQADYDTAQGTSAIRSLFGPGYSADNESINSSFINSENQKKQTDIFIRQAYINQDFLIQNLTIFDSFSLRAGKLITKWGYTEFFNPVDIINPQDYSFHIMNTSIKRKRGVYAIYPTIYFSRHFSMDGFINPIFEADNEFSSSFLNENTSHFMDLVSNYDASFYGEKQPEASLRQASYGARAGLHFTTFQGHFMYYRGYDHSPTYTIKNLETEPSIEAEYRQLTMSGLDFMANMAWDINLKGELAYYHTGKTFSVKDADLAENVANGKNGYLQSPLVDYIVGLELVKDSTNSTFLINLEYNQNIIIDHRKAMEEEQYRNRFISEIQIKFAKKKAYILNCSIYSLEDKDLGSQFELGLKPENMYVIKTGYWMFHKFGNENGFMGRYDKNDFIYFAGDIYF
ncbi:MAG: hypothetical protein PF637_04480 [Spirochaetes bacterium]|jgi:hypothetical protein|nr:hypothetical protein [Spirochaetota bacterium]